MVVVLPRVQIVAKGLVTSRINAMQSVYIFKPDSSGLDPRVHTKTKASAVDMDTRVKPEYDGEREPEYDGCGWHGEPSRKTPPREPAILIVQGVSKG